MDQQLRVAESQCGFCKGNGAAHMLEVLDDSRSTGKGSLGQEKKRDLCYISAVQHIHKWFGEKGVEEEEKTRAD